MQPVEDSALLRQYAENHSDEAFAALVTRYVNLVYSVALRHTGNPHHAEEITQDVFIALAKKAGQLRHAKALSSWLFQATRLTAINFLRSETRRHHREDEAYMQSAVNETGIHPWTAIAPLLDTAVAALREQDRQAILLRFYEGRNLREVGRALGTSEDAAEKRLNRSLEKLRHFFTKHGVTSTTAVIAGAIAANSVQAGPTSLAKSVTAIALAKGALAGSSTLTWVNGALKIMAWTKAHTAIAGALLICAVTYSVMEHKAPVKLQSQNESPQPQITQPAQLNNANPDRSASLAAANRSATAANPTPNPLPTPPQTSGSNQMPVVALTPAPPVLESTNPASIELPKDSWTNAGFATPLTALQTRGAAILSGNRDLFAQSVSLTADARKLMEDTLVKMAQASNDPNKDQYIQEVVNSKLGAEEAILMPLMALNQNNNFSGYKVLSQQSPTANETTMEIETDMASGSPQIQTLNFQRFGDDWKVVYDLATIQKMIGQ